jgi:hypothetical protein
VRKKEGREMKKLVFGFGALLLFIISLFVADDARPAIAATNSVSVQTIDGVPSIAQVGTAFVVTPTILNSGVKTKKTTIKFYLMSSKKVSLGSRKVIIGAQSTWSGDVVLNVPKKTKEGMYYLLACIGKTCVASATQVQVVKTLPPPIDDPPPPPPIICTDYVYSSWSACDQNGQQTRSVTGYSPAGCTGSPATLPELTWTCTPPPPPPPPFTMDGVTGRTAVDVAGNLFTLITKSGFDSLVKSDPTGNMVWETVTGCERSSDIVLLSTNAYVLCKKGTGVFVEVVDKNGQLKTEIETQIATNGEPMSITADPSTGSLYIQWIDWNSGSTMPWMARADQDINQTSGFINGPFDRNVVIGTTGVYVSTYNGGASIAVDRYSKDLSTKTSVLDVNPAPGDACELSGLTLSSDEKILFVTGRINMFSNYKHIGNILIKVDTATNSVTTTDLGLCYGAAPADLTYDPSGLYSIVQATTGYSIIRIDPATGVVTPLVINLVGGGNGTDDHAHLTVDAANGRLYLSHMASQPDTVGVWDLSGNPL